MASVPLRASQDRDDAKLVLQAAAQAQKAADFGAFTSSVIQDVQVGGTPEARTGSDHGLSSVTQVL